MPKAIKLFRASNNPVGINLEQVIGNDRITLSRTPIGAKPGEEQYYLKRAVKWKGKKAGSINAGETVFIQNAVRVGIPEGTAKALYQIAEDSRRLRQFLGNEAYGLVAVTYWNGETKVLPIIAYVKLLKKLIGAGRYDLIQALKVERIPTRKVRVSDRPGSKAYHIPIQQYTAVSLADVKNILFKPQEIAMRLGNVAQAGEQMAKAITV